MQDDSVGLNDDCTNGRQYKQWLVEQIEKDDCNGHGQQVKKKKTNITS